MVFPSRQGPALEERNVQHVFKRMLDKAKLRHIRIHDLRHTFASLLLQQGESVVYVKEQLGHGSIQITVDTYGHLIPGANRGAINHLDDDDATQPDATQAQPRRNLRHSSRILRSQKWMFCSEKVVSRDGIERSTRRLRVALNAQNN